MVLVEMVSFPRSAHYVAWRQRRDATSSVALRYALRVASFAPRLAATCPASRDAELRSDNVGVRIAPRASSCARLFHYASTPTFFRPLHLLTRLPTEAADFVFAHATLLCC